MEDCNQPVLRPNLTATNNPPTEAIPSTFRTTCSSGFGAHHLPKRLQPFLIIFVSSNLSKDQTFKAIQKALRFDQVIRFPTIKRALRALPDERPSDSHQRDMVSHLLGTWGVTGKIHQTGFFGFNLRSCFIASRGCWFKLEFFKVRQGRKEPGIEVRHFENTMNTKDPNP